MNKYIFPFAAYALVSLAVAPLLGTMAAYAMKTIATGALLLYFWKQYDLSFSKSVIPALAGILVIAIWIWAEGILPVAGSPDGYFPANMWHLIIKIVGMVVVAPVIEEVFTRDFLMRYSTSSDWRNVPLGKYTPLSFAITTAFFGFAHNRWAVGIITGVILNLLLYRTKNLGDCVIAHSVANAILAGYVIFTGSWFLW